MPLAEIPLHGSTWLVLVVVGGEEEAPLIHVLIMRERGFGERLGKVGVLLVPSGRKQIRQADIAEKVAFFEAYGLADVPRVTDPDRTLYRAFKLRRGRLRQLFGFRVWRRAFSAALRGHWPGSLQGDSFQMPGLFLIRDHNRQGVVILLDQLSKQASF